ncbi:hypothetical protein CRYUN_Cryun07bG0014700 [Craigia yunnanensis]
MGGIGVVIRNVGAVMGAYAGRRSGDALRVIKKIQGKEANMSPIGALIEEARVRKVSLQFCKFTHIGRLGNMVAHMLAKHGLELEEYRFWVEDCPDFV